MHDRDVFYRAIKTISSMPPHPNIQPPPHVIAVAGDQKDQGQKLLCGTLYRFMACGTLDDQVMRCKSNGTRIELQDKALWCFQLSSALAHTHHVGHTYHMDIKPANVVVDDHGNAILIDWEQSGAPLCTLTPEANGDWDVEEMYQSGASSKLVYTYYNGPICGLISLWVGPGGVCSQNEVDVGRELVRRQKYLAWVEQCGCCCRRCLRKM